MRFCFFFFSARSKAARLGASCAALYCAFLGPALATQAPADPMLATMIANAGTRGEFRILRNTLLLAIETQPQAAEALLRRAIEAMPKEETKLLSAVTSSKPEIAAQIILPGQVTIAQRQKQIADAKAAAPQPSFFDLSSWTGEATLGGSLITGNTEEQAINVGLKLDRAVGKWEHSFVLLGDYSRNQGEVTKQRVSASYNTKWFALKHGYVFGLLDFEYDDFQLFDWRLSEAVGVGYRLLRSETMTFDLEGGPGARQTQFAGGELENEFICVLGGDYDWTIREGLTFSNDTSIFLGADRTTLSNIAAFTAQLTERISGRFSFEAQHDTSVPLGQDRTQTATRASIVYGF